jgi:ABC-type sugar transport system permease subunit
MRDLRHFIAACLLVTLGLGLIAFFWSESARRQFQNNQLLTAARSAAWVVAQEELLEDPPEDLAQSFFERLATEPAVDEAFVLKGTKVRVHSDPEQSGRRLDRESLADKDLYDAAREMKSDVRKNLDEREKKPDLTFDPYPEAKIERLEDGRSSVKAPVKIDDDFEAMVQVTGRPEPLEIGYPVLLFVLLVGAILVYAVLRRFLPEPGRLAVGGVTVVALALVGALVGIGQWRADARAAAVEREAQLIARLGAAGLLRATPDSDRPELVGRLARDVRGRETHDLLDVRSSTVAGTVSGEVHRAGQVAAVYASDYQEQMSERDRGRLTPWAIALATIGLGAFLLGAWGKTGAAWMSFVDHRRAYGYLSPAMMGLGVLVFIPVTYGIVLGFMNRVYNDFQFAGLENYVGILSDTNFSDPQNFYFTTSVTIMWTVLNVGLHVGIGLFLALLLNDSMLKARGVFRVLLIVPWAVPNYITALIWKQMFHREFGAINFFLAGMGFEPISWFQSFWPSFFTNLATNTWLGFPFMMVVSLGALQSIPQDLYEAAFVDGASRWQRFKDITLPLLMPALVPAVIVGSVWTFNMFNIIYLVSGGAPNGATDILITEAFRWAFERDSYGYAAAYSTIIFIILLVFTITTNRITGATKGAFE